MCQPIDEVANSSAGSSQDERIFVLGAVHNKVAVVAWPSDPMMTFPQNPPVNHPNLIDMDVALLSTRRSTA